MPGNKILSLIYVFICFSLFCLHSDSVYAESARKTKRVLVLHGEWEAWKWVSQFDSHIHTAMTSDKDIKLSITYEFLGLEYISDDTYPQDVIDHLRYRIQLAPIDLVIATLPRANKFLLTYGEEIFPEIPKIFAVPAASAVNAIKKVNDSISIRSAGGESIKRNIERIFSILPDTEKLVVVCGNGLHDQAYLSAAKAAVELYKKDTLTDFLVGIPLEELSTQLSQLPKHSAVLCLTYEEDLNKKRYSSFEVISHLSKKANAPVFGFYDTVFGSGIVGGNLTSAEAYGKQTAEIGLKFLKGELPSDVLSVVGQTYDIYDWRQLKRWNIPEDRLPAGSMIRFRNDTFWEIYKIQIIIAILFICFQTLLIYILFVTLRKRRRSETDLRKSQEKFKVFIEKSPVGIAIMDMNTNIEYLNVTFIKLFGYVHEDIPTMNHWLQLAYTNPQDRDLMTQKWSDAIRAGVQKKDMEPATGIVTCKDGTKRYIEIIGSKIGEKFLIIFKDNTEQKRSEEELVNFTRRLALHVEQTPLGAIEWDLDFRVVQWNQSAEKIFGYTREEALGRHAADIIIPDISKEEVDLVWQDLLAKHGGKKSMNKNNTKDGKIVTCEWYNTSLVDSEGIVNGVASLVMDISEAKNLEEQLRQVHKMEAIGTLAGGIAHDFNNILSAILGYSEMVNEELPESSPAKEDIQEVLKAVKRATGLVKQILAFSRKSDQERVPVEIHLITREALKLIRASIPTTIEIHQDIRTGCGTVHINPTQIHQVIMNLCTNAAQAMDEDGGILDVSLSCLELSDGDLHKEFSLTPGPCIKLTVKDTGPGIKRGIIDRIFDPYFTTKEVGKGSGMGLAVVHGIVKSHNGMITVDSAPGLGTTFNVFLPKIEETEQQESDIKLLLPLGKERILVVDDEVSVAKMTKQRLVRLGYRVTTKFDSINALESFRSQPDTFDLIITDQTMPNMTGEQLANEALRIKPDIPIILCTGYSAKIDAEKAGSLGIRAFIMKPVDNKELAHTIRQVLD